MELKQIGIISSPYSKKGDAPKQGRFSNELSQITIFEEYLDGLDSIEKHSHLFVLYWFDKAERDKLKGIPPGKTEERGVFTIRSPIRPNPIALCLVELIKVEGNILTVKWLDALDGSPLLDIKPFLSETDCIK
ncbi:tRNA (N6-threonylcarbamoyladenosine(37)-N6)-methyltransferase TrmO [Methanobacterium sp. ACI-7]|uniref:tRNA (N6-threonylcarbamoyladenosine(37)-N6)-methyltransferase TrmO n=1 Tax=unclassified Methanobacterium TaxID=2627676 RepID=UPI0039C22855